MRHAEPILAVANLNVADPGDQPSAATAAGGYRSGRHRGAAGRRPWRAAIAGLALITSGLLIAGPVSATPAGTAGTAPAAAPAAGLSLAGAAEPRLAAVVRYAMSAISQRVPYTYGGGHGATPSLAGGADCSGFIRWAYYQAFGTDIGSGSADSMIRTSGKFTMVANPVPGDVALFGNGGEAPAFHAGIYIGQQDGRAAMAAEVQTGETARVQYVWGDLIGYYRYRGAGAADLPPPGFSGFNMVAAKAPTRVAAALTAGTVSPGQKSGMRVAVRTTGDAPLALATVTLYSRTPGHAFAAAAQATTDSRGNAVFSLTGDYNGHVYSVRYGGDTRHNGSYTPLLSQWARSPIRVTAGLFHPLTRSSTAVLSGATSRQLAGAFAVLQVPTGHGWVQAGGPVRVSPQGGFTISWSVGAAGHRDYRVHIPQVTSLMQVGIVTPTYPVSVR
jgi:cell wall-associated NlpC family hydrolase